jgi:butyrate kinase
MGSGISVSAHQNGRMIDNNTGEEGPFGVDRSGSLPVHQLIKVCFSGLYTQKQLDQLVFGAGGLSSYLDTKDFPLPVMPRISVRATSPLCRFRK